MTQSGNIDTRKGERNTGPARRRMQEKSGLPLPCVTDFRDTWVIPPCVCQTWHGPGTTAECHNCFSACLCGVDFLSLFQKRILLPNIGCTHKAKPASPVPSACAILISKTSVCPLSPQYAQHSSGLVRGDYKKFKLRPHL